MIKSGFHLDLRAFRAVLLSIILTVGSLLSALPVAQANQAVGEDELVRELSLRMDRVPQFAFMRAEAEKLGVKVYLFGGTASSFAHYVRWDMLRERGEGSYLKEFFDYDFFSIYRSTQDLDVVVDGPSDKAVELGRRLRDKFPSFQGSKDSWEVRLLREAVGEKRALLGDPDFNKQHSDSNSTGLIEITRSGEPVVRDLRGWDATRSRFLEDVAQGKITYYFSPEHETTARYLAGKNPPIYSVIRYLTKAFQYGLDLRPEDVTTIRKMTDGFDPVNPGRGIKLDASDFDYWMHGSETKASNAKKLFLHAVDVEFAWNTLEALGLRKKLIALKPLNKPAAGHESLEVVFNREPLRSKPIGTGHGKTAEELGIDYVAHETRAALALESITRSKQGLANSFISRNGHPGENAMHGDGFYTKKGLEGAVGSGLTIRFRLDSRARLGTDFKIDKYAPDYIVVVNKLALHVIPESLDAPLEDWFKVTRMAGARNLGLLLRLDKRLQTKWHAATDAERENARTAIKRDLQRAISEHEMTEETATLLSAWFKQPLSALFPEEALAFLKANTKGFHLDEFMASEHWRKSAIFPQLLDHLLSHDAAPYLFSNDWFRKMMSQRDVVERPEWVRWMKQEKLPYQAGYGMGQLLSSPAATAHPKWNEIIAYHLAKGNPVAGPLGDSAAFDKSEQWDTWMRMMFESKIYVKDAEHALFSERARKDPRWRRWLQNYTKLAYEKGEGLIRIANAFTELPHDAHWIAYARSILTLPENHPLSAEERRMHPRYKTDTDLSMAKSRFVVAAKFDDALLKTDLVELGLRSGDPVVIDAIQWNVLEHGKLADRPDLFVLWMKVTKRRWGGPPKGSWDVMKHYVNHPAFRGVIPLTPGWLFALVEKGWDIRDGRFQTAERSCRSLF